MSINKRFWITWLLVVIVCWLDYRYLNETNFYETIGQRVGQMLHVLIYAIVVVMGYVYFKTYPVAWPKYLWLLSYVVGLLIYATGGFLELFVTDLSLNASNHFSTIRLFFTSPLPLIIIYLMYRISLVSDINSDAND